MKKTSILLFTALLSIAAMAKTPKADRLFERWEYFKAAQLYEKEAAKNPSPDVYFKLGECYRKMNNYKKEEQAADDKVNAAGTYSKPEFYLNYGQVLKTNGKYDQAKVAFDKYTELMPSDPRGAFYSASIAIVAEDHKSDEQILVSNVSTLNSKNADFSPVPYMQGLVFTTDRKTEGHSKVYGWTGANYMELYYAKTGTKDSIFTDVTPFGGKKIDAKYHDGMACFSRKFDTIYLTRVEKDLKGEEKKTLNIERNKLYYSTMKDGNWTKAVPLPFNSDSFSVANPFLSPDGSKLYFVSDMPGGFGKTDIYYCNREGAGWGKPINMGPNVNTFGRERCPNIDSAGNFYFASDGYQGFGGLDICVALNKNGTLQKATPMKAPFNSSADDYGIIFLKGGKTGYICSNRPEGGKGDDDILYFNMATPNVDSSLVASAYTIGYKRKPKPEPVAVISKPETPIVAKTFSAANPREEKIIYFDFDKSLIRKDAITYLDSVVSYMKRSPEMKLVLGGHCDRKGTDEYNMNLSNRRDDATVQYLLKKGIKKNRIVAKGYGATQMVNRCAKGVECSDAEDQMNRRVEFHFEEKPVANVL
jgi:outer membrane protein OmpA-like peptidoglycan-associated protein/tetratricopeptide (TPR) repeat protein